MPIRSVSITKTILRPVSSITQRNVTETGQDTADCSMLKCLLLYCKFRHRHCKVTVWWANIGSGTSGLHLHLSLLLWLLVSMQFHAPNHTNTTIYHLCGKLDWSSWYSWKNSTLLKKEKKKKEKKKNPGKKNLEQRQWQEGGKIKIKNNNNLKIQKKNEKPLWQTSISVSSLRSCTNGWANTLPQAAGNMNNMDRDYLGQLRWQYWPMCNHSLNTTDSRILPTGKRLGLRMAKATRISQLSFRLLPCYFIFMSRTAILVLGPQTSELKFHTSISLKS